MIRKQCLVTAIWLIWVILLDGVTAYDYLRTKTALASRSLPEAGWDKAAMPISTLRPVECRVRIKGIVAAAFRLKAQVADIGEDAPSNTQRESPFTVSPDVIIVAPGATSAEFVVNAVPSSLQVVGQKSIARLILAVVDGPAKLAPRQSILELTSDYVKPSDLEPPKGRSPPYVPVLKSQVVVGWSDLEVSISEGGDTSCGVTMNREITSPILLRAQIASSSKTDGLTSPEGPTFKIFPSEQRLDPGGGAKTFKVALERSPRSFREQPWSCFLDLKVVNGEANVNSSASRLKLTWTDRHPPTLQFEKKEFEVSEHSGPHDVTLRLSRPFAIETGVHLVQLTRRGDQVDEVQIELPGDTKNAPGKVQFASGEDAQLLKVRILGSPLPNAPWRFSLEAVLDGPPLASSGVAKTEFRVIDPDCEAVRSLVILIVTNDALDADVGQKLGTELLPLMRQKSLAGGGIVLVRNGLVPRIWNGDMSLPNTLAEFLKGEKQHPNSHDLDHPLDILASAFDVARACRSAILGASRRVSVNELPVIVILPRIEQFLATSNDPPKLPNALSNSDERNRFKLTVLWCLPEPKYSPALEKAIGAQEGYGKAIRVTTLVDLAREIEQHLAD